MVIDGFPVKVIYTAAIEEQGRCDYQQGTIFINDNNCREVQDSTLLHELAHFRFAALGLKAEDMDEEAICNFCEGFARNILRDREVFGL